MVSPLATEGFFKLLDERRAPRGDRQFSGRAADSTFANAGAFDDPFIARIEGLLEVAIRDDLVRQGGAPTQYARTHGRYGDSERSL